MKFTINVDCTPQEAREFIGLPNIKPMQEKMMEELQTKMMENMQNLDAETMMKTWMNIDVMQSWGDIQKSFWGQMTNMAAAQSGPEEKE